MTDTIHATAYSVTKKHNAALGIPQFALSCGNRLILTIDQSEAIYTRLSEVVPDLDALQRDKSLQLAPRLKLKYQRCVSKTTGREEKHVISIEQLPPDPVLMDSADRQRMVADLKAYAEKLGVKSGESDHIIHVNIVSEMTPKYDAAKLAIAKLVKLPAKPLTEDEQAKADAASEHLAQQAAAMNKPEEIVTAPVETQELTDALGRAKGEPPADNTTKGKSYRTDAKAAVHALPNHIKKVLGEEPGMHIRKIFNMSIDLWMEKNDNDAARACDMVDEYCEGYLTVKSGQSENAPKSNEKADISHDAILEPNDTNDTPIESPAQIAPTPAPIAESGDAFKPDPFLTEAKTLMGIPALRIQEFINRKYEPWAYGKSRDFGKEITVIDPLAVRQRFDKIFGPHGIGWRIVPANTSAQTFMTPFTEATKSGERDMYSITISGYCMEYRMRIDDTVEWQRTSAFTDSSDSADAGYAGGGAFTGLMKQALKMLGGYDHFILPGKKSA